MDRIEFIGEKKFVIFNDKDIMIGTTDTCIQSYDELLDMIADAENEKLAVEKYSIFVGYSKHSEEEFVNKRIGFIEGRKSMRAEMKEFTEDDIHNAIKFGVNEGVNFMQKVADNLNAKFKQNKLGAVKTEAILDMSDFVTGFRPIPSPVNCEIEEKDGGLNIIKIIL